MGLGTIHETCKEYLNDLAKSFPEDVKFLEKAFIAGGCIRSLVNNETPADIDIFLKDDSIVEYLKGLTLGFTSKNAISFVLNNRKYQIIINTFGTPEEIVSQFDFTCNMNYFDGSLQVKHQYDIELKQLRINPTCRNKLGTLTRIPKFISKGYSCPPKEDMLRLGVELSKLEPITDGKKLIDESRLFFSEQDYEAAGAFVNIGTVPYRSLNMCVGSST